LIRDVKDVNVKNRRDKVNVLQTERSTRYQKTGNDFWAARILKTGNDGSQL